MRCGAKETIEAGCSSLMETVFGSFSSYGPVTPQRLRA
jgi:hypothetical protein